MELKRIISLKEFALTGQFGPIGLGMRKDELIAHLGEPEGINRFGKGSAGLNYAWYEFFYSPPVQKITGIQNDHLRLSRGDQALDWQRAAIYFENDQFRIDTWFLKPGEDISYFQVIDLLNSDGIPFQEIFNEYSGWRIQFESGVFLDFDRGGDIVETTDPPTDKEILVVNGIRIFERNQPRKHEN